MTTAPTTTAPAASAGTAPSTVSGQKTVHQELLMLRYVENSAQARHHEALRERTTATIAATASGLLGLLALGGGGQLPKGPIGPLIGTFIVLLGIFGAFASWLFDNRARIHRGRIESILKQLDASHLETDVPKRLWLVAVWYVFHAVVATLGAVLLVLCWRDVQALLAMSRTGGGF